MMRFRQVIVRVGGLGFARVVSYMLVTGNLFSLEVNVTDPRRERFCFARPTAAWDFYSERHKYR